MYNQFVEEQVNTFERRQRERQAEMLRMAQSIDAGCPSRWAQLCSSIQGTLARMSALARFRKTSAAHERSRRSLPPMTRRRSSASCLKRSIGG